MSLSSELISLFAKTTVDKKTKTASTVYGTIVKQDGKNWVQLDGSDLLTPFTTTTDVKDGERVTVTIKDHSAIVTGNTTEPSGRHQDIVNVSGQVETFEVVMADTITADQISVINATVESLTAKLIAVNKLDAVSADIENLTAIYANLERVDAKTITAINAEIEKLEAKVGEFSDLSTDELNAIYAEITTLQGHTADFTYVSSDMLKSQKALIDELDVKKLDAESAKLQYVNIDFANVDEAWFNRFYATSGIIQDVTISEGVVVKELVGVTITGDLIRANTLKVDRLVVRGSDGNYYAMNTDFSSMEGVEIVEEDCIHGSVIVANSITAEKIKADDLTAFGATIAGFNINRGDDEGLGKIYSKTKESVENSTRGLYMDDDGQFAFGDESSFIKFHKVTDENGNTVYKLDISADSILFGSDGKSTSEDLKKLVERIKMGTVVDDVTGNEQPCIELSEGDTDFKQIITNTKTMFVDGDTPTTQIDTNGIVTDNLEATGEFRQGGYVWETTEDGGLGLMWREKVSS